MMGIELFMGGLGFFLLIVLSLFLSIIITGLAMQKSVKVFTKKDISVWTGFLIAFISSLIIMFIQFLIILLLTISQFISGGFI